MNLYNKETIFHLPALFSQFGIYQYLLTEYTQNPQYFKDNVKIGSIYDCPSGIWNGGRLIINSLWSKSDLEFVKSTMAHYNIPVRFTFTNCLLEEKHTYDTYCNMILEIFNTGNNEIICNSEVLERYIKKHYGNSYKYISSTTKRLTNKQAQTNELYKDYYLVVLDYDYNKDYDYLTEIEDKSKCELLCNAVCRANCPNRDEHYKSISQCQLDNDGNNLFFCDTLMNDSLLQAQGQENFISPEDINNIYLPMGFKNFKLEGRTMHSLDFIEILLYYLIKEEYKSQIRMHLQKIVW